MIIDFHKDFIKAFRKLSPKTKKRFQERLLLFEKDQFSSALNNHALCGKYQGYKSINVTGDIRAIYGKNVQGIIFIAIGSHSSLYG
jgi:addiction module RelE/StbE family toxin